MVFRFSRLIIAIALILIGPFPSAHANDTAVRKQIQAIFDRFEWAYETKNAKAIQALMKQYMTPDFTRTMGKGKTSTLKEILKKAPNELGQLDSITNASTQIKKLVVKGNLATVITDSKFTGFMTDVHKITLKLSNNSTILYTFIRTPGGWKAKQMRGLTQEFLVNDKPIPTPSASSQKQ